LQCEAIDCGDGVSRTDSGLFDISLQQALWDFYSRSPHSFSDCISDLELGVFDFVSSNDVSFSDSINSLLQLSYDCNDYNCSKVCGTYLSTTHPCREYCADVTVAILTEFSPYFSICCTFSTVFPVCNEFTCSDNQTSALIHNNLHIEELVDDVQLIITDRYAHYNNEDITDLNFKDSVDYNNKLLFEKLTGFVNGSVNYFSMQSILMDVKNVLAMSLTIKEHTVG